MKKIMILVTLIVLAGSVFSQDLTCADVREGICEAGLAASPNLSGTNALSSSEPWTYEEFKMHVKMEKGTFLEKGSMAYLKYKNYNTLKWCGVAFLATGFALAAPVGIPVLLCLNYAVPYVYYYGPGAIWYNDYVPGIICMSVGGGLMVAGAIMLGCMGSQLKQSYYYYTQGQKKSVSINWHPAIGTDYAGVGMTTRF